MCIHEFNLSTACGHHFPKQPPSAKSHVFFNDHSPTIAVPESLTCIPVKLALKFYHDQIVYRPTEQDFGAKLEMPRLCSVVHSPSYGLTERVVNEHKEACHTLDRTMRANGLGRQQRHQIEIDAAALDRCSNRAKPGGHSPLALQRHREQRYPRNMYDHVQSVKAFQARDESSMAPNVRYTNVDFGCGGPFSAECLTGWDGKGLLTHRLHLWGDTLTHPKPCNHECLAGWSGAHLDKYRQQTWTGATSDDSNRWKTESYCKRSRRHAFEQTQQRVIVDYENVMHLHADQFKWNGTEFVRIRMLPDNHVVWVPEKVEVLVPERLDQVLRAMLPARPVPPPGPQVHGAEGLESASTLENQPLQQPEWKMEETPEMAEARGQRARKLLREKLKRDFPRAEQDSSHQPPPPLPPPNSSRPPPRPPPPRLPSPRTPPVRPPRSTMIEASSSPLDAIDSASDAAEESEGEPA